MIDSNEAKAVILDALSAILKCKVDYEDSRSTLIQWDSLKHIEIIFAVEDQMNIEFSEDEIAQLDSVKRIIEIVLTKYVS